ncbi:hypothetical protein [Methylogaea oryzae]|uniref:hypothetical protein n=1 Tax=Methylogaea oryzae TaxID=1295382 RepID=UPI0006CF707F|nr:hypothetical protein [Methylogaea oryzae]
MKKIGTSLITLALALSAGACSEGQLSNIAQNALKPQAGVGGGSVSGQESASAAPVTYSNKARKFHFTIPAGWAKVGGDPEGENAQFQKVGGTASFQFHYTSMASNFPAEASVKASLTMAKDEIKQGKNIEAKRRDDKCQSNPKVQCARGWELIDAGKDGHQRIIWQAYDKDNYYYNFMGASDTAEFQSVRASCKKSSTP